MVDSTCFFKVFFYRDREVLVYFQKDNCFHRCFSIPWVSKVDNFNIQDGKHVCEGVHGDLLSVSVPECGTICMLGQIFNNSQKRPKHQKILKAKLVLKTVAKRPSSQPWLKVSTVQLRCLRMRGGYVVEICTCGRV